VETYFRKFTSSLPDIQRRQLETFLRRKSSAGVIKSQEEFNRILESIAISEDGQPMTTIELVDEDSPMSAAGYNALMDSILIDMRALFTQLSLNSFAAGEHENTAKQWIGNIGNSIKAMERKVDEYKRLYGNTEGYTATHHENFSEVVGADLLSTLIDGGLLTIEPRRSMEFSSPNDIRRVSTVTYPEENHAAGIYLAAPKEYDVERDYDTSGSIVGRGRRSRGTKKMLSRGTTYPGYWMSILLTDRPTECYVDSNTYQGYVVLLRLFLNGVREFNEILIDPVGKYRSYVQRIRYRTPGDYSSDADGWSSITYTNDNGDVANLTGSGYGAMMFRFPPIVASAIEIMFNAPDSDIVRFRFSPDVIRSALLWDEITEEQYRYLAGKHLGSADEGLVDAQEESSTSTSYMDRVIVDIGNVDSMNDVLATVKASLNIDSAKLTNIGNTGTAVLTDRVASAALGDYLLEINKHEYTLGAYSITPQKSLYPPSGVFISHVDGGYDTYENRVREVMLEATQSIPALTSIEYFLVVDTKEEIPILPRGTSTYREHVRSIADAAGDLNVEITFYATGDVSLYKWNGGVKTLIGTETPSGKSVAFAGCSSKDVYAVEYTIDTTYEPHRVAITDVIPSGVWLHTEIQPDEHRISLPTSPHIDYERYNWDTGLWNYNWGVAGFYSDPTVLEQDMSEDVWEFAPFPGGTGIAETSGTILLYANRNSMLISGWFASGWHHVSYVGGTDSEYNEYDYMWGVYADIEPPGGWTTVMLDDDHLYGPPSGHTNRYEPMELFVNGTKGIDRTSWKSDIQTQLDSYDNSHDYQYYLLNDVLYTNIDFESRPTRRVAVKYRYLTTSVALKIVMYTNESDLSYYAPYIDNYKLLFLGD